MTGQTENWPYKFEDIALEGKITEAIVQHRKKQHMKLAQVAERLGVSSPALSMWEHGVHVPDRFLKWQEWAKIVGLKLVIELRDHNGKKITISGDD